MDHEKVIETNIEGLVKSIDVKNSTLWERLTELGMFKLSDVEDIRVSIGSFFTCHHSWTHFFPFKESKKEP